MDVLAAQHLQYMEPQSSYFVESRSVDREFGMGFVTSSAKESESRRQQGDSDMDEPGLLHVDAEAEFTLQRALAQSPENGDLPSHTRERSEPPPPESPEDAQAFSALEAELADPAIETTDLIEFDEGILTSSDVSSLVHASNLAANGAAPGPLQEKHGDLSAEHKISDVRVTSKVEEVESTSITLHKDGSEEALANGDTDLIEYVEEEDGESGVDVAPESPKIQNETDEENAMSPTDLFDYVPLPCVLLSYRGTTHAMFNIYQENLDLQPIFDEEQEGPVLFEEQLTRFISEVKGHFEIDTDISLEFPQLDLTIDENMYCVHTLSLNRLYEFFMASSMEHYETDITDIPLKVTLIEHPNSFAKRLEELHALAINAGIISSEDESESPSEGEFDDSALRPSAYDEIYKHTPPGRVGQVSGSRPEASPTSITSEVYSIATTKTVGRVSESKTEQIGVDPRMVVADRTHSEPRPCKRPLSTAGNEGEVKRART
ncbi:hypothetical protein DFJ77DRAFT_453510 [Powellomyces hirtus]|nr:hypothetical protein DFJ77DRAFT_453510 [Powellomyces hirtus]